MNLDKYTQKSREALLTAMARQGKLEPVIGCDEEVRRTIQIFSRLTNKIRFRNRLHVLWTVVR